jgi:hypothetical protein
LLRTITKTNSTEREFTRRMQSVLLSAAIDIA